MGNSNVRQLENIFIKAAMLLFPDLDPTDPRLEKVARYAQERFYKNESWNCVLVLVPDAKSRYLRSFARFCKKLNLDCEKREIIISGMDLLFSSDFEKIEPEEV